MESARDKRLGASTKGFFLRTIRALSSRETHRIWYLFLRARSTQKKSPLLQVFAQKKDTSESATWQPFEKAETHKRRDARTDETVAEVDKVNIVTLGSLLLNVRACWAEDFVFSLFDAQIVGTNFFFSQFSFGLPFFFRLFFHSRSSPFLRKVKKTHKKKVTVFSSPFRLLLLFFFVFLRRGTLKIWLAMLYEQRVILSGSPPCDRFCVVFSVFVAPNKTHF